MATVETISCKGFLDRYKRIKEDDQQRRFCFILGAGASVASGIPAASKLANMWLQEMHAESVIADSVKYDDWFTDFGKSLVDFDPGDLGAMYFQVYEKRFDQDPRSGSRYLEKLIESGRPSYGYYALAHILAHTADNLVITVNFDNLVADALHFFLRSHPIVCGHDRVAALMPTVPHRPTVIKVHHDIYLDPLNRPESLTKLGEGFAGKLPEFLKAYTPVVIGYGGNDGSLMQGLGECPEILGGIYWCLRETDVLHEKVLKTLSKQKVCVVRIPDFDGFMAQLAVLSGFELNEEKLIMDYREDIGRVKRELDRLAEGLVRSSEKPKSGIDTLQALDTAQTSGTEEPAWWKFELAASKAATLADQEQIYQDGIARLPDSSLLLGNYAAFLHGKKKDFDAAEVYYKRALEADPNNANALANYATFLHDIRKEYDAAEVLYKRALSASPENAHCSFNYAAFLHYIRKDYDAAEQLYKAALEQAPGDASIAASYGVFLEEIRKDYPGAERLYKQAIQADPKYTFCLGRYAVLLQSGLRNLPEAEKMYKRVIDAGETSGNTMSNYAGLLFALGRREAYATVEQAIKSGALDSPANRVEIPFYEYANGRAEGREAAINVLHSRIVAGDRSPGWNLDANIARAQQQNHPEAEWLPKLAAVVTDRAEPSSLVNWPLWRDLEQLPPKQA